MFLQLLWNAVTITMALVMQWAFEALRHWLRERHSPQLSSENGRPAEEGVGPSSDGRPEPVSEPPERLR